MPILYTVVQARTLPKELKEDPDPESRSRRIESAFEAYLGKQLPDLSLRLPNGARTTLSAVAGRRTVIFYAGGPCPHTLEKIKQFAEAGWKSPQGRIVTVLHDKRMFSERTLKEVLVERPDIYAVERWPSDAPWAYLHMYPGVFIVSEEGLMTGFYFGTRKRFGQVQPKDGREQ